MFQARYRAIQLRFVGRAGLVRAAAAVSEKVGLVQLEALGVTDSKKPHGRSGKRIVWGNATVVGDAQNLAAEVIEVL